MRVGLLTQWFTPETGPASIPGVLARGLADMGHEVSVLTGLPNYPTGVIYDGYRMRAREDSTEYGYALRRVALYPSHSSRIKARLLNYGSFAAAAAAWGTSALEDIDVLWVYNSPATVALPMWVAKARYRAPVVLHVMDMWPDSVLHAGFAPPRGTRALMSGLDTWVGRMYQSSAIVAYITPSAGDELARRGVPSAKLRFAPIWVDETIYRPAEGSMLRGELGYADDDVVVSYAGALGRAQRVTDLVEAVIRQPPTSRIRCMILGSGTEEGLIRMLAREYPDRVSYLGQVPHEKMTAYAAAPDMSYVGLAPDAEAIFAAPSKVPAIMACAKPIVAAASGDTATLVRRSGSGLVVESGDVKGLAAALQTADQMGRESLAELGRLARKFYEENLSCAAGLGRIEALLKDARSPARPPGTGEGRGRRGRSGDR